VRRNWGLKQGGFLLLQAQPQRFNKIYTASIFADNLITFAALF